ncbi:hypothetical protein NDU88_008660, partial [Pleurodeles waltl]
KKGRIRHRIMVQTCLHCCLVAQTQRVCDVTSQLSLRQQRLPSMPIACCYAQ